MTTEEIIKQIEKEVCQKYDARFSLGIIQNGVMEKYLVGENGLEDEFIKYYYEIGSITKTFTGILIERAVMEKNLNLTDSCAKYIPELSRDKYYPSIKRLVTHTSGYRSDEDRYDENGRLVIENYYRDFTKKQLIDEMSRTKLEDRDYPFSYSNFGAAVTGVVLENIYDKSYEELIDDLCNEIGLRDTYTLNPPNNLDGIREDGSWGGHWLWNENSVMKSAGYLTSTLDDMLRYAQAQIDGEPTYILNSHKPKVHIDNIGIDRYIGTFWMVFPDINAIFHNGGTGCFNTGFCVDLEREIAVVALSNYHTDLINNVLSWTYHLGKSE